MDSFFKAFYFWAIIDKGSGPYSANKDSTIELRVVGWLKLIPREVTGISLVILDTYFLSSKILSLLRSNQQAG